MLAREPAEKVHHASVVTVQDKKKLSIMVQVPPSIIPIQLVHSAMAQGMKGVVLVPG